tara:strand:- start:204 stop:857 length:654 start_codon:yes stop_codon:yes gene_type:complete
MADKKIVLFDLDGTLIDTAPDMYLALSILLNEENKKMVSYDKVRTQVSNGVMGVFSVAFSDDPIIEDERFERYLDIYETVLGQECKVFNNAYQLLDSLDSKEIDFGVVTNKSSRFAVPLLHQFNLLERMKTLVCGDEVRNRKPDPEPLFKALDKTENSYNKKNVYYVGDAKKDITAARAADIRSIACTYGYREADDDPTSWNSDFVINNIIEVNEIV